MDRKTIILGKRIIGRKETLEYLAKKYNWQDCIIGISAYFGFWAWIFGRLTRRKVIYYCIDFYSPKIAKNLWDRIFIWAAMNMDKFLTRHCDKVWDISAKINEGRWIYGKYEAFFSKIVPLCYPPDYFRFEQGDKNKIAFVGLQPYGLELLNNYVWLKNLPIKELLYKLSLCGIGISLWRENGNNYYGDPGKTKLYSACGLPVIMTINSPYAKVIMQTNAGMVIPYDKEALEEAIQEILAGYDYFKENVKKTWRYINADDVSRDCQILEL